MKKRPGDIILNMCTTNDNHMKFGSWDIEYDGQNVCLFGPFVALYPEKSKFWKNEKNARG